MAEKHFVTFLSPGTFFSETTTKEIDTWSVDLATGTFFSETTTKEIDTWSVDLAMRIARDIKERHGATPYGFRFETKTSDGWETKTVKSSGIYYLGGRLLTIDDIPDTQENRILRSNMKCNEIETVIENTNSWKVTMPFDKNKDVLLMEWF